MPATESAATSAASGTTEPELYLRLLGERTLLARDDRGHWGQGDLGAAASALVAVGLLPMAVAVAVVEDYQLAIGLRGDRRAWMMRSQPPTAPVIEAPTAPVVAGCRPASPPADDGSWAWDVHHVVFGDSEAVLTVSSTTTPPWERGQRYVPGAPPPGRTPALGIADDSGHLEQAHFSGGGGGDHWSGHYTTTGPLSPTTRWLDFDGRRLDVVRAASRPTVRVEDHGTGTPAERYLRHRLAAGDLRHHVDDRPDAAVEALVATGLLAAGSPVATEIEAVRAAHATSGGLPGLVQHGRTAPVPSTGSPALPGHWASVLRAGPARGPAGTVPLGVATPIVDGTAAVLRALTSTADEFTVDTVQVGGDTSQRHGDHVERVPSFAWWAQDDLGQWYRGEWNGWSGGEEGMSGDVLYLPPLDPRARTVRLLPTMPCRRAVVEITLPEWGVAT